MLDRERLRSEVERVHRRYAVEVVEALGICPWAKQAREDGRVQLFVCWGSTPSLVEALAVLDEIERQPQLEIGFLAYPELTLDRLPFSHFVAELRASDAARKPIGETVLAMADFHPNGQADESSAERLVPLLRRSPDPTIQLVRRSALQSVRLSETSGTSFVDAASLARLGQLAMETLLHDTAPEPLAARVARNNQRTVQKLGLLAMVAIVEDILNDRDRSYARFGATAPAWRNAP